MCIFPAGRLMEKALHHSSLREDHVCRLVSNSLIAAVRSEEDAIIFHRLLKPGLTFSRHRWAPMFPETTTIVNMIPTFNLAERSVNDVTPSFQTKRGMLGSAPELAKR